MRKSSLIMILAFAISLFSTTAFAGPIGDDAVLSQHVKEADGTSGQDTNTGSGIKTGHIQDGAVATDKIAEGAVSTSKIADQSVTSQKIADGAVTDAQINGPISANKISSIGLDADTLDGKHASDLANAEHTHSAADIIAGTLGVERVGAYTGIKIVHKGAADGVNTFNQVLDAAIAIGTPTDRHAILVMPGTYNEDLSPSSSFQSVTNIDIIGQSRTGTTIKDSSGLYTMVPAGVTFSNLTIEGTVSFNYSNSNSGLYNCTLKNGQLYFNRYPSEVTIENVLLDNAYIYFTSVQYPDKIYLRNIQIKNTAQGITGDVTQSLPLRISNVAISGVNIGVFTTGNILLENASIQSSQSAFLAPDWSTITCTDCKIDRQEYNDINNGTVKIVNSSITMVQGPGLLLGNLRIGNSKISGPIAASNGLLKLVNCFDDNYDPLPDGAY